MTMKYTLDIHGLKLNADSGTWFAGIVISITLLIFMFFGSPDLHDAIVYKLFDGNTQVQTQIINEIEKEKTK